MVVLLKKQAPPEHMHDTTITKERILLLFCIIKGLSVDVGKLTYLKRTLKEIRFFPTLQNVGKNLKNVWSNFFIRNICVGKNIGKSPSRKVTPNVFSKLDDIQKVNKRLFRKRSKRSQKKLINPC